MMRLQDAPAPDGPAPSEIPPLRERLRQAIETASHLLPSQGPITVFIHHNTLHAFEDVPFFAGVRRGAEAFDCQPFLTEDRYRQELQKGRIRFDDLLLELRRALSDRADEPVLPFATRLAIRSAMLQFDIPRFASVAELEWYVAETDALHRVNSAVAAPMRARLISETRRWVMRDLRGGRGAKFRELLDRYGERNIESWDERVWEAFALEALWQISRETRNLRQTVDASQQKVLRHRDLLLQATDIDTDLLVGETLIRFSAAYLDQGFSAWELPDREQGFFRSFAAVYGSPCRSCEFWQESLASEVTRITAAGLSSLECAEESLSLLGVPPEEWGAYLSASLTVLRGWGGMIQQVEERGDRAAVPIPKGSLLDFVAVRLLLDRVAIDHVARRHGGYEGALDQLRAALRAEHPPVQAALPALQRSFTIFLLAQSLGWSPEELTRITSQEMDRLLEEIETFSDFERRSIFHLAYERRFRTQTLDALALHPRHRREPGFRPRFQAVTCLDEREESFRRHIEEIAPEAETFGAAGFFAVAMYYRGEAEAHFVPLCPIVVVPGHWVAEEVADSHASRRDRRAKTRQALAHASHRFHVGSRSFAIGAMLSAAFGALAAVPLIARVWFPRLTSRIRNAISRIVHAPAPTHLKLERRDPTPGKENGSVGFNLDEMTNSAERLLRDIGLTRNFSRLALILGHGSNSQNNPHKSAYDCGACGGSPGAPNARAAAQILNDHRVRAKLLSRGIAIPDDTVFVGGFHNTCNDSVTLLDRDRVPDSHRADFQFARETIDAACERNAHERSRRFMSAPLNLSFAAAKQHVETRSEDLAQTRPELGHATNAIAIVGRRERTRGLYFDRRAFLTCYDPTQDTPEATILDRTLCAVFPVCGGINLEYYFSHVDSAGYGSGTKLPHNITSLLGVMDGAASDLRTGLPWQMVEIHEPVRLLIVVETTETVMRTIMERRPMIGGMVRNGWVQVALLDPDSQAVKLYQDGDFRDYEPAADRLPHAPTSTDWYRGWRDHLEFAEIGSPSPVVERSRA